MTALPTFPLLYRSQPIDEADHQRPEQGIGDIQIGVGRSPAIGEIVEDFIARLGQDDTQKGYEAAIRPACHEPSNQENDEPAVDKEEVVGEPRLLAAPQAQTDRTRDGEGKSVSVRISLGGRSTL